MSDREEYDRHLSWSPALACPGDLEDGGAGGVLPGVQGQGAHVGQLLTRRAVTKPRTHEGCRSEIIRSQHSSLCRPNHVRVCNIKTNRTIVLDLSFFFVMGCCKV